MNPQQNMPQYPASSTHKKSTKLPIILMAWPAAAIVASIILYMIIGFLIQDPAPVDGELFARTNPVKTVFNTVLFITGAASVAFGPISFVIGLVLLIQRKSGK